MSGAGGPCSGGRWSGAAAASGTLRSLAARCSAGAGSAAIGGPAPTDMSLAGRGTVGPSGTDVPGLSTARLKNSGSGSHGAGRSPQGGLVRFERYSPVSDSGALPSGEAGPRGCPAAPCGSAWARAARRAVASTWSAMVSSSGAVGGRAVAGGRTGRVAPVTGLGETAGRAGTAGAPAPGGSAGAAAGGTKRGTLCRATWVSSWASRPSVPGSSSP